MARAQTTSITREQFSILHELLFEKCYADIMDEAVNWPDTKIYGHNKFSEVSIRAIAGLSIGGRTLRNAVQAYHKSTLQSLSKKLVEECLEFLEYPNLKKMEAAYLKKHKLTTYAAPNYLKYGQNNSSARGKHTNDKLSKLENTLWWSYSRYRNRKTESGRQIIRLPLEVKSRFPNGDYEIELNNEAPFTSFTGRIIKKFSSINVLTCELTSKDKIIGKRLYLLIHIDPGLSKDLYLGCFLRHTDGGSVYSGSFVIEKEPNPPQIIEPKRFVIDMDSNTATKRAILDYLYDRRLNTLKIPSNIFSEIDFNRWMKELKPEKRGRRMPEYDLFIAAPIKGFEHQLKCYDALKNDLRTTLEGKVKDHSIIENIDTVLKKHLLVWSKDEEIVDFSAMREKVKRLIARLKEKDIGFKKIWYSAEGETFSPTLKTDSSVLLLQQLSKFAISKRILLMIPTGGMISSVYLEAGWAMISERDIPVFIVANRQDLPFLLRKADTLKNRKIYMASWDEVGGIEGIADWIYHSGWHKI